MDSLKALIECLIRANTSIIWVSLHFGPFNQWKWRRATTFLWQNELEAKLTPPMQFSLPQISDFLIYIFFFSQLEHPQVRPCPDTVHRQHCQREQTWFKAVSLLTRTNQPDWRKAGWQYQRLKRVISGRSHIRSSLKEQWDQLQAREEMIDKQICLWLPPTLQNHWKSNNSKRWHRHWKVRKKK